MTASARLSTVSRHMSAASSSSSTAASKAPAPATPDSAGPSDAAPVLFQSAYSTRTFVLNKPKALNALDQEMIDVLTPKIKEWDESELCKIIPCPDNDFTQLRLGTGNGRAFCAGGEVKSVVKHAANDASRQKALDYFQSEFQLDYNLATLSKPYISIMDGITSRHLVLGHGT